MPVAQVVLGSAFGVTVVAGVIWAGVKYIAKKYVDSEFDRRMAVHKHELVTQLERYKNQLTIEAEAVRTDNQRRLRDFGLFTEKKHTVYPEMYKLLRIAFNRVQAVTREFQFEPHFDALSADEISEYMKKRGVPENDRLHVLAAWNDDNEFALSILKQELEKRTRVDIRKAIHAGVEYLDMNTLYLSGEANAAAQMSLDAISRWFAHEGEGEGSAYERLAAEKLSRVLQVFSSELRTGDYEKKLAAHSSDTLGA